MRNNIIPHFAVIGRTDTGKTTLVTKLIKKLVNEGFRVATLKHTRGNYHIDQEGKDTWKHAKAGSSLVVFATPGETSFMLKEPQSLEEILTGISMLGEYDLVLVEGWKDVGVPCIDLNGLTPDAISQPETLIGDIYTRIVREIHLGKTLDKLPGIDCKKCGFLTCKALSEAIYKGKNSLDDCITLNSPPETSLRVRINGDEVTLTRFPRNIIKGAILGMLQSLKGVDEIDDVEIKYGLE